MALYFTSVRKFEDNLNWKLRFEESENRCNELTNQLLSLSNFENESKNNNNNKSKNKNENGDENENLSAKEHKLQATTMVLQKFNHMLTSQRDKQSKDNLQLKNWIYSQLKLYRQLHCQFVKSMNNFSNTQKNGDDDSHNDDLNQFTKFWDQRILYFENNFLDSNQRETNSVES